ncbi:hypothetical protein PENSPDRAFT_614682 [Peniophora sp. CONT]|nr:hypothetical protein PENSPDRAFT_614682 [Peniophora sp. CONT]
MYAGTIAVFYGLLTTHWALQFRSVKHLLSGSALGVPLTELTGEPANALDNLQEVVLTVETLSNTFFVPVTAESALFGVSVFLFAAAVYYIIKSSKRWHSFSGLFVRGSLFVMFAVSLAHWASVLFLWSTMSRGNTALLSSRNNRRTVALFECWAELLAINIALSDSIVLWRMCVLWAKKRSLVIISCVLISATLAMSIGNIVVSVKSVYNSGISISDPTFQSQAFAILGKATPFWIAELALSWATNVFATSMIAIKAWRHRRRIRAYLSAHGTTPRLVERLMTLLVESGTIYTSIWTAFIVTGLVLAPDRNSSALTSLDTWDLCMAQLTLIYPTIIIILVTLERTHCENGFTFQTEAGAAAVPATQIELNDTMDRSNSLGRSSADIGLQPALNVDATDEVSLKSRQRTSSLGWKPPAVAV